MHIRRQIFPDIAKRSIDFFCQFFCIDIGLFGDSQHNGGFSVERRHTHAGHFCSGLDFRNIFQHNRYTAYLFNQRLPHLADSIRGKHPPNDIFVAVFIKHSA